MPAAPASAEPMKNVSGDGAVDVDAHQLGGLAILGGGAHRTAHPRPADEQLAGRR